MKAVSMLQIVLAVALSPLLPVVIQRVKALFAGRQGPPWLQGYFDLWKLLRKGGTYSRTTTWVFRAGPLVNFACLLVALLILPLGGLPAVVSFDGDWILLAYMLALGRFCMVVAALDTGSSFEGMGASREVQFAVFTEPALLLGLAALARETGMMSLSGMYGELALTGEVPFRILLSAGMFILYLAENCRIPVDDPATHLELTMIHEVMVLDHGAVDFGLIQWGGALKLWVVGALWSGLLPLGALRHPLALLLAGLGGLLGLAVLTGVVESVMARLRLLRMPQLLVGAGMMCALSLLLTFR
ncbi:MAG: hydrogenase [Lentisphaerae bacterium]|nr:hydrogenase [Lentisphaerota bacterium]